MASHRNLFALAGAALLLALTVVPAPASADPPAQARVVIRADNTFDVIAPADWSCDAKATVLPSGQVHIRLDCFGLNVGLPPQCGTVTAGVTGQTGGAGETTAVAICGATAQAVCHAWYDPVTLANDCAVSASGSGVAACAWVTTANVNYNRVGFCNFPVL